MGLKIYIDGKLVDKENAKVSVFDHGLLYGDGVFEGIRSYGSVIFKLQEHIDRLYESAHTLLLEIPLTKAQMIKAVVDTLKANKFKDAYIRLVVTRGVGDLGLDPRKCKRASIIIIADKIVLYPEKLYKQGLKIITVPTVRNLPEALNPQIKSLNYLNNILAKIEATNAGYEEAIMLNSLGYVAECTGDNIFLIKNGALSTPPQSMGTLRGITRDAVIELAKKAKMPVCEPILTRHDVYNADEAFLTGTAAEIIPVVCVDGRVIGDGKPGKLTKKLLEGFKKIVNKDGVKYKI
ncbi:MAG: branched-chain-amino-acid transaminase [Candidatus Omnitrophota bacterium]